MSIIITPDSRPTHHGAKGDTGTRRKMKTYKECSQNVVIGKVIMLEKGKLRIRQSLNFDHQQTNKHQILSRVLIASQANGIASTKSPELQLEKCCNTPVQLECLVANFDSCRSLFICHHVMIRDPPSQGMYYLTQTFFQLTDINIFIIPELVYALLMKPLHCCRICAC